MRLFACSFLLNCHNDPCGNCYHLYFPSEEMEIREVNYFLSRHTAGIRTSSFWLRARALPWCPVPLLEWQRQVIWTWSPLRVPCWWRIRTPNQRCCTVHLYSYNSWDRSHILWNIPLLLSADGDFFFKCPDNLLQCIFFSTEFLLPSVLETRSITFQIFSPSSDLSL